jgi:hypothetical protein
MLVVEHASTTVERIVERGRRTEDPSRRMTLAPARPSGVDAESLGRFFQSSTASAREQESAKAPPPPAVPQIGIHQLADQVIQQIDSRLVAFRERMGRAFCGALTPCLTATTLDKAAKVLTTLRKLHTQGAAERAGARRLLNPEEYTINKDNNFAVQGVPRLPAPIVQFVNGNLHRWRWNCFSTRTTRPRRRKGRPGPDRPVREADGHQS